MEGRFGIPVSAFAGYLFLKRKKSWSILKNSSQLGLFTHLKVSRVGLKAFQNVGAFVKPTTRLIQMFGHMATRAVVEIDKKQLMDLLADKGLPMELPVEKGYVILRMIKETILGLGFYAQGRVRSQLPKKEVDSLVVCGDRTPNNDEF